MRKALIALALGFGWTIALTAAEGTALAQKKDAAAKPAAPAAKPAAPSAAPVKPPKQYSFDADEIQGELVNPTGDFKTVRTFAEHGSLIRVRADFVPEIVKSAEDL